MTSETASLQPGRSTLEIVNRRAFDAPCGALYAAFENPEMLARWWGPAGFRTTIQEFDLRPGGAWRLQMHAADGTDYDNVAEFVDVMRPTRIVYDHLSPMHRFRMTMLFAELPASRSELTWRMAFDYSPENERLQRFLFDANEQNFDRLGAMLKAAALTLS